jgi:uncharacterized protein YgbK (DUF1537 family)
MEQFQADVFALNSGSRNCSAAEAKERVGTMLALLPAGPGHRMYKKVDSSLRGSVGSELSALLEIAGPEAMLLAPAYPAQGHITVKMLGFASMSPSACPLFGRLWTTGF